MKISKFNKELASIEIEKISILHKSGLLDACIFWANSKKIEIEDIKFYISDTLLDKLRLEAINDRTIRDSSTEYSKQKNRSILDI